MEILKGEAQGPPGEKKSARVYSFSGAVNGDYPRAKNNGDKI
jgi:hypothetical protein